MKTFAFAAVMLATQITFAQVTQYETGPIKITPQIREALGTTRIQDGVRIEAMDLNQLRESLRNTKGRAVLHVGPGHEIELEREDSTGGASAEAARPGVLVGSGGGTMDEDVIDLVDSAAVDTSFRLVGLDLLGIPACPSLDNSTTIANQYRPCYQAVYTAIVNEGDAFNHLVNIPRPLVIKPSAGMDYFSIETSNPNSVHPNVVGVSLEILVLEKTDVTRSCVGNSCWGRLLEDESSVYHSSVKMLFKGAFLLQKGKTNIFPVRKVSFRSAGEFYVGLDKKSLNLHIPKMSYPYFPIILKEQNYQQHLDANLKPIQVTAEPSVKTLYLGPGKYRFSGSSSVGKIIRDVEIK